jgi:hypothetical protein
LASDFSALRWIHPTILDTMVIDHDKAMLERAAMIAKEKLKKEDNDKRGEGGQIERSMAKVNETANDQQLNDQGEVETGELVINPP